MTNQQALGQYFTPRWVAEAIVEHHFSDLRPGAVVVEPSCGDGAFLQALPSHVNAFGVEIDPHFADIARKTTGRQVLLGDILTATLPSEIDAIIGNPPFQADTIAAILDRAHPLLVDGGKAGFILPAYVFQTSSKVMAMAKKWSISQQLMPRNIFQGLSLPLVFALFTKEEQRKLFGFFLYRETAEITSLSQAAKDILNNSKSKGSVWRQAVHEAFELIDSDTAHLDALYKALESRRPTDNPHFREKVRQTLQRCSDFEPVCRGQWRRVRRTTSNHVQAA